MSVHYKEAANAEEIAKLLRSRGRTVITAPPRCGKTTELIRYAEERNPNGRFAVVCASKDDFDRIVKLHWRISNKISFVDVVAKRLLGETLEGEDTNEPILRGPDGLYLPDPFIPVYADDWHLLSKNTRRAIMKRRLWIAAVALQGEDNGKEES